MSATVKSKIIVQSDLGAADSPEKYVQPEVPLMFEKEVWHLQVKDCCVVRIVLYKRRGDLPNGLSPVWAGNFTVSP